MHRAPRHAGGSRAGNPTKPVTVCSTWFAKLMPITFAREGSRTEIVDALGVGLIEECALLAARVHSFHARGDRRDWQSVNGRR